MSNEKSAPATSSAKFRDGDIVRVTSCPGGRDCGEDVVIGIGQTPMLKLARYDWIEARQCALLRRPVRVGDVLDWDNNTRRHGAPFVVAAITDDFWRSTDDARISFVTTLSNVRHSDGTPIEPPPKTSGSAEGPVASRNDQPSQNAVSTTTPARGPEEAGFLSHRVQILEVQVRDLEQKLATARADTEAERRRANRAADAYGDLQAELDELTHKIGRMTRDADRLTRVTKGGRRG